MAVRPAIVRSSKGVGRTTSFTQLPAAATTITSAAMARSSARWSANDYLERHWNACAPQLSDSVYRLHHIELREVDYAFDSAYGECASLWLWHCHIDVERLRIDGNTRRAEPCPGFRFRTDRIKLAE